MAVSRKISNLKVKQGHHYLNRLFIEELHPSDARRRRRQDVDDRGDGRLGRREADDGRGDRLWSRV